TGTVAWRKSFGAPIDTSLHDCAGSVYFGAPPAYYRIDPATGDVTGATDALRAVSPYEVACSPAGLLAFSSDDDGFRLTAIDHDLRRVMWRKLPPEGTRWTSLRPLAWRGLAIAGTDRGDGRAYRFADGRPAWRRRAK